ncbi:MAG: hypothetical protein KJO01_02365 [Gammaproteobacteria bacterium]|nr:hypothetical protein [Gammaproteobacteria bacterium]MBT8109400.1 hypothetical protein [Gammaproteobacteria bacterium]NND46466.1 hypothetical protein [Woeseiaceae bacterium]NNL44102.1 hypothetical protein [Woeseiaceae bacterium]
MKSMPRLFALTLLFMMAATAAQDYVPADLQDWQEWVLKDKEYRDCPFYFNRNAAERQDFVCSWPGQLTLSVAESGAEFTQQWTVYAEEQWLSLPGSVDYWPEAVTVNDQSVEVIAQNNVPSVRLAPGTYRVAGRFGWDERPGVLRLPPESGLVALDVDGRKVERPEFDRNGIFLGERKLDTRVVNSVRAEVHRLVVDDVPTRLITQLQIDVSGSVREELFGPILPDGFVPLNIHSPLPAKLEADGNLRFQVRPGRWTIYLNARGPGAVNSIVRQGAGTNLPASEIWSYQSNDRLRVSVAEGLPPVDPRQVQVPGNWQNFPAFRVDPGATFAITERSRGVVSATNELSLARTLWLDFDGGGFVVKDSVGGRMRTDWRLDMGPPYTLLSATENARDLLITKGRSEGQTGVELRQTNVSLAALGRMNARGSMPVTGWETRFTDVRATLNLPPGNKLLVAPGVDSARGSWLSEWQLLDFFLVLIITIAVWRLIGRGPGIIAVLALVLSFHEPYAPSWLWVNLLIAIALMRVAPAGRLRQIVSGYQLLSAVALVIALVPFVANQLRIAIYPQLEPQYNQYQLYEPTVMPTSEPAEQMMPARESKAIERRTEAFKADGDALQEIVVTGSKAVDFVRYAPNAIVQAGPGIPSWQWNTYALGWSGPVDAEQTMRLVVLPRWLVSALRVLEVALLLLFAAVLAAEILNKRWALPGGFALGRNRAVGVLAVAMLATTMPLSPTAEAQMPDANLLKQLEQRLTEPPDCVPRCAEIVSADVAVGADAINMRLGIHAMADIALPLPGSADGWQPQSVLLDGTANARVLRSGDSSLWLHVGAGRHSVTLRGPIRAVDSLELAFQSPPRVITVDSDGWFVAGIKDRRLLSGSLQLTRLQTDAGGDETVRWESSRFPAFARVERTVELDLDWRVRTTVYRVAPMQGGLTLDVPLIDGEKIISGEFTVENNRVLVSMSPQQQSISWTSNLPRTSPLTLTAEDGAAWNEVWRFAVGNIWNAGFEGVPESDTGGDVSEIRVAEFNPRGGEQLTLVATRPEAAEGSTLAFDSVNLAVTHGSRSSDTTLRLGYRSTRGAQHVLRLPDGAEVTSVQIDGLSQSLRAEGGELTLPILPGEHAIQIDWRQSGEMGLRTLTPAVDIGAPASNIELSLTKPRDRWLLGTSGPQLGPAVLYWSELAVLVLFALILGRVGLAPLRSRHWLLLGLGFSTFSWPVLGIVVAWLLACGVREKWQTDVNWWRFNLIQLGIGGLSVVALLSIATALPQGLLGTPDMHVAGHNSYGDVLSWFADSSDSALPVASVFSVPLWIYKALILAWALWLSFALVRWLPWVWQCFSSQGYWRFKNSDALRAEGEGR